MKNLLKRVLLIASIVGVGFFSTVVFLNVLHLSILNWDLPNFIIGKQTESKTPSSPSDSEQRVRIKIPRIGVDTVIESVGLTPSGAMAVPKTPADVAWFNLGPYPGEVGAAVLAGHYGEWKNGQESVFDNLHQLKKGDKVYVTAASGAIVAFVVRESRNYDPSANASDVFTSTDGQAHLNLITCEGVWNEALKSYSQRLVVFTDKE